MWESCTPGFRSELLVQDGRATASALRAVGVCPSTAQALCKTLWFSRRCWAGCRHATPGTEIRCGEQPSCTRPMGSQPLPHRQEAYKATPPTPSMQTCLPESLHSWAQARTFPFFDQKQSFLSGSDDLPREHTSWQRISVIPPWRRRRNTRSVSYSTLIPILWMWKAQNAVKPPPSFSSVAQSCLTLCDPMDCSRPGLPVHHQLPEFTQIHVHWVGDAIQPSHPLSSPSSPSLNLSQHQGLFQWVNSSHQVAKGLEFQLQHQSFQWISRTDFL